MVTSKKDAEEVQCARKNLGINWIFFFDLFGVAILWKWFSELANIEETAPETMV